MFLLLAAPSAPAEVTAPHVSSRGAAMGTGASSPHGAGTPSLGSCGGRTPWPGTGAGQGGRTWCGWHPCPRGTQHAATLGQRSGEGARGPPAPRQPHLLLVPLSQDGFQLLLLALRRWCQQQHSHCPGTHRTLSAPPPARGYRGCPVLSQLRPVPLPCARDAQRHAGAVLRPHGITLCVPPALWDSVAGPSVWKQQGALTS